LRLALGRVPGETANQTQDSRPACEIDFGLSDLCARVSSLIAPNAPPPNIV
jgi:hypothetical protein